AGAGWRIACAASARADGKDGSFWIGGHERIHVVFDCGDHAGKPGADHWSVAQYVLRRQRQGRRHRPLWHDLWRIYQADCADCMDVLRIAGNWLAFSVAVRSGSGVGRAEPDAFTGRTDGDHAIGDAAGAYAVGGVVVGGGVGAGDTEYLSASRAES